MKKNKKGISEIVSYVLLVIIAVGISVLVYGFLYLYVPKEKPECVDGISIVMEDITCQNGGLHLTLKNTGRFKINAVYVRLGDASREFREWVNDPLITKDFENFNFYDINRDEAGLFPGDSKKLESISVTKVVVADGQYILEAQPAIYTGKGTQEELALCSPVTQTITCTT